jgi:single-strand DNA-binding protein
MKSSAGPVQGSGFIHRQAKGTNMPNSYKGTGNLADSPSLKTVQVNGEDRKVAELRVFFDHYRPDGQGGLEQTGGHWLDVSVWDYKAEQAARLLRKGARVHVIGRLELDSWTDRETGEPREKLRLVADDVLLSLTRVKGVEFEARRGEEERNAA